MRDWMFTVLKVFYAWDIQKDCADKRKRGSEGEGKTEQQVIKKGNGKKQTDES